MTEQEMSALTTAIRSAVDINHSDDVQGIVATNAIHTAVIGISSRMQAIDPAWDHDGFVKACGTVREPVEPAGEKRAREILEGLGFSREVGGGGAAFMSRYFDNGWYIWATSEEGQGMPSIEEFTIGCYAPDWRGIVPPFYKGTPVHDDLAAVAQDAINFCRLGGK